jgi:hypothetical protein
MIFYFLPAYSPPGRNLRKIANIVKKILTTSHSLIIGLFNSIIFNSGLTILKTPPLPVASLEVMGKGDKFLIRMLKPIDWRC